MKLFEINGVDYAGQITFTGTCGRRTTVISDLVCLCIPPLKQYILSQILIYLETISLGCYSLLSMLWASKVTAVRTLFVLP